MFPEHTHIPRAAQTPYPAGGELPPEYSRTYDPFVALTAAAAATERLTIGTGICLVIERDPIITAKEVASLDRLSGGRFLFGVGAGWNAEEMRNHGTDPAHRFGIMRERIEAMKAIWSEDEASYAAATSTSSGSGAGRSRSSSPTRRSWSAATARRCSTGCSRSATSGCRTGSATTTDDRAVRGAARGAPRRRAAADPDHGRRD